MKLMSDQEHNRRVGEIRAERNRREEQEFRQAGLFGRPLTAEERATKDEIRRKWDEWESQSVSELYSERF